MVCVICGSLDECSHDELHDDSSSAEDHGEISPLARDEDSPGGAGRRGMGEGAYEMVTNALILPRTEVFNTYGSSLSNAQLLARYGFMLPEGNEGNDGVRWRMGDLRMMMRCRAGGEPRMNDAEERRSGAYHTLWRDLVHLRFRRPGGRGYLFDGLEQFWEKSDLVVVGRGDDDNDDRHQAGERSRIGKSAYHMTEGHNEESDDADGGGANVVQLGLDGDARMTWQLWTFCVLLNLEVSEDEEIEEEEEDDAADTIIVMDSARAGEGEIDEALGHGRFREVSRVVSKLRQVAELQLNLEVMSRGVGQPSFFFFFFFSFSFWCLTNVDWMNP
jgi:hypothetical protein